MNCYGEMHLFNRFLSIQIQYYYLLIIWIFLHSFVYEIIVQFKSYALLLGMMGSLNLTDINIFNILSLGVYF